MRCATIAVNLSNWSDNVRYRAKALYLPVTLDEVIAIVRCSRKVRVLGTRHSFNRIADSNEILISLKHLNQIEHVDLRRNKVTVQGGITYSELCPQLNSLGFALRNLASLPHISIAGACATATHGSGLKNGNLATAVSAMEVVCANGEVIEFSPKHGEVEFKGAVVSLGGLGVVTRLELDIVPTYDLAQCVYQGVTLEDVTNHFDHIMRRGYSVSLFTEWSNAETVDVWIKRAATDPRFPSTLYGAARMTKTLHPIRHQLAENCTRHGSKGPWHERLPHFRPDRTPSTGNELQSEYFVDYNCAAKALRIVGNMRDRINPLLYVCEVRAIKADNLWMSPSIGNNYVGIHFTWRKEEAAVRKVLGDLERKLEPCSPRPHWGKLFVMSPGCVKARYPRRKEFCDLVKKYDPGGKFRNRYLDDYIF